MNACYARLQHLPRARLEELSVGIGTDDECEVVGAQVILAWLDREPDTVRVVEDDALVPFTGGL